MDKFYLEIPSLNRKIDIIDYFNEFVEKNSISHGSGILYKIIEGYSYEEALEAQKEFEELILIERRKINDFCGLV